jgi:Ion channel
MYLLKFREKNPKTHFLWWLFSDCGRSFGRWALWSLGFAIFFSLIFLQCPDFFPDWWIKICNEIGPEFEQTAEAYQGKPLGFRSSLYFSIVTFTTLGFGDVIAANYTARFLVAIEVILGYIMLGGLISILANKLARRS